MPSVESAPERPRRRGPSTSQVLVVTSVMFTFISFWRTAAIVLCDLASTAYYIGGIVESQIGAAAPWFILAVMIFSYGVRSIYIESCAMFVRGGVYRVVKEAMGGTLAKLSVSALLFDYILTGPTSGVSAGQYIVGWLVDFSHLGPESFLASNQNLLAAGIAVAITVYFWRVNLKGIHESSDQALRIMGATTVMGIVIIVWCGATLAVHPEKFKAPPLAPNFDRKVDPVTHEPMLDPLGRQVDPLGFLSRTAVGDSLRSAPMTGHWFSLLGVVGLLIAFGHSILAMSGEETLAQVYREVESPKLKNFKKAAFIVFVYSVVLTAGISFLAVLIIPDEVRMKFYSGNLISGLARHVVGPPILKLGLETFVVVIGFMILAGAVNTAIIGSNGVLNRVAEDGVLPDWFLKPHPRYGTTFRLLFVIAALQIGVILISQ